MDYSFDSSSSAKAKLAKELIEDALDSGKGVVSYQVVQELLNVALALRQFVHPMSLADAEQCLSVRFRPLLVVHSSESQYGEALRLFDKHKLSWYDALILASALEAECAILYSEDFRHGRSFGDLKVRNPFL